MNQKTTEPNPSKEELKQMLPGVKLYPSITVITNRQQLTFIQECIKQALHHNPTMAQIQDEWDNNLGEVLIDMLDDTLDDPSAEDSIHGFVL